MVDGEGMEEVHGKACSGVIYGARSVTKASETVAAAEVVCHALNESRVARRLPAPQRERESGPVPAVTF